MSKPTYDAARTFDATLLNASYQDVGAVMGSPALSFVIYNTSDVDVQLSFDDGVSDGPIVPTNGTYSDNIYNYHPNQEVGSFPLPKSAQIQVKQVTGAGTSGDIIINIARES